MAETTIPAPFADTHAASPDTTRWRVVGALGLSHVGVMLAAFALEGVASAEHGKPASSVLHTYASASMTRVELASYVEAMAFLPLLAALVVLVGLLSRTETGRTAGQVALGLGVAYVASTFAVGFPPLTAAVYAAHHGVDAATLATVNDIRNYGFLLQVALSAALALAWASQRSPSGRCCGGWDGAVSVLAPSESWRRRSHTTPSAWCGWSGGSA